MHANDRILVVDDVPNNLLILEELLGGEYTVVGVDSGAEAVRLAPKFRPNLVLLDVMMPGMDGAATCQALLSLPQLAGTKIVMLSANTDIATRLRAYEVGAVDYITKPFHDDEVLAKVRAWMRMAYQQQLEQIWNEAEHAREILGTGFVTLTAFRDTETGGHLCRVRWYSYLLAEQLAVAGEYCEQIDERLIRDIYRASPLHDIGKIAIDPVILHKPGPLTADERLTVQEHARLGGEILDRAAEQMGDVSYLPMAAVIARHHHERFDGRGYPDQLSGAAIPLPARIVALADVFDAISSPRCYKAPVPIDEAIAIVRSESGSHFDPEIVAAFCRRTDEIEQACLRFADDELGGFDGAMSGISFEPVFSEPARRRKRTATTRG